jgi:hypothetical protein
VSRRPVVRRGPHFADGSEAVKRTGPSGRLRHRASHVTGATLAVYDDGSLRVRPKLEICFDPAERRRNLDLVTVGPSDDLVHWVRLRVSNAKGRRSAEKVEVFLLRCERRDAAGTQTPVNERPLSWSGVREPDDVTRITRTIIPPGVTRHIDLLSIQKEDGEAKASLRVVPVPREDRHKFTRGEFHIELVLAAQDVNARRYKGSIAYDGGWAEGDEMWQHVRVQIAKAD